MKGTYKKSRHLGRLEFSWRLKIFNPYVTYAATKHKGRLFWITCKWLKLLRKASCLHMIQNLVPSVVRRRQCDIWMTTNQRPVFWNLEQLNWSQILEINQIVVYKSILLYFWCTEMRLIFIIQLPFELQVQWLN